MTINTKYEQIVLAAVQEVIEMVFSEKPVVKKTTSASAEKGNQVIASIGLSGSLSSSLVVAASEETACILVSKMLGSAVTAQSQDMIDGMGEMANIIGGLVKTKLSGEVDTINLSLPTVVSGGSDLSVHHWIKSEVLWISVKIKEAAFAVLFSYATSPAQASSDPKNSSPSKSASSQDAEDALKKILGSK